MNDSNKTLKIIFTILLLVTIGELIYFFSFTKKAVNLPSSNNSDSINTNNVVDINKSKAETIFNKEVVKYLANRNKMEGYKLYFQEEKSGKISDISFKKYTANGFSFEGYFVISNNKGEELQKFAMTKNRINTMKFYQIINNEKVSFDFYNLKLNQKITYIFKSDMTTNYDPKVNPDGDIVISEFIVE